MDRSITVCSGIVDLTLASAYRSAKVDAPRRVGTAGKRRCRRREPASIRNRERAGNSFMIDRTKIVAENEELVLLDRTADRSAKVVVRKMTQFGAKIRAGIHGIVLDELESRSVETVGTRFQRHVRDCAGGAAQFGLEVIGGDIDTGDRFRRRNDDLQKTRALIVVNAFNLIQIALARQAVGFCLQGTRGIEKLRVLECCRRRARHQVQQRLKIPIRAEGHVQNLLRLDLGADVGAVGLQHRRCSRHCHRLRHIPRLHRPCPRGSRSC